jgi:hypothetical protein
MAVGCASLAIELDESIIQRAALVCTVERAAMTIGETMRKMDRDRWVTVQRTCLAVIVSAAVLVAAGCKGGSGNQSNSPTGPSSTTLAGTWTGTLSRPEGLGSLAVRWQVTQNDFTLTGPLTLTRDGVSVTVPGRGSVSGNDNSGYRIHMSFMGNPGDTPTLPNCAVRGNVAAPDPIAQPFTTISTSAFDVDYNQCQGFIDPPPQRTLVTESSRLNLTRQ